MVKKTSETALSKRVVTSDAAEALARQLADKPYGAAKEPSVVTSKAKPISISLPPEIIEQLEDTVLANKRSGIGPRTISALIKDALAESGYKLGS